MNCIYCQRQLGTLNGLVKHIGKKHGNLFGNRMIHWIKNEDTNEWILKPNEQFEPYTQTVDLNNNLNNNLDNSQQSMDCIHCPQRLKNIKGLVIHIGSKHKGADGNKLVDWVFDENTNSWILKSNQNHEQTETQSQLVIHRPVDLNTNPDSNLDNTVNSQNIVGRMAKQPSVELAGDRHASGQDSGANYSDVFDNTNNIDDNQDYEQTETQSQLVIHRPVDLNNNINSTFDTSIQSQNVLNRPVDSDINPYNNLDNTVNSQNNVGQIYQHKEPGDRHASDHDVGAKQIDLEMFGLDSSSSLESNDTKQNSIYSVSTKRSRESPTSSPKSPSFYFNGHSKKIKPTRKCQTLHCNGRGNLNKNNRNHFNEENCPNATRFPSLSTDSNNSQVHNLVHLTKDACEFIQKIISSKEIEDLRATNQNLKEQLESLVSEKNDLIIQIYEKDEKLKILKDEIDDAGSVLSKIKEEESKRMEAFKEIYSFLNETRRQLHDTKIELTSNQKDYKSELKNFKDQVNLMEEHLNKKKDENNDLFHIYSQREEELQNKILTLEEQKKQVDTLKADNKKFKERIDSLQESLVEKNDQNEKLQEKNRTLNSEISSLKTDKQNLEYLELANEGELTDLKEKMKKNKMVWEEEKILMLAQIEEHENSYNRLKLELETKKQRLSQCNKDFYNLKTKCENDSNPQINDFKRQFNEMEKILRDVSSRILSSNKNEDSIVGTCISKGAGFNQVIYEGPRGGLYYIARENTPKAYKSYVFKEQVKFFSYQEQLDELEARH